MTVLSALASVTSRIGLAGTVSTSYSDPFTVARQFASLDLLSGGRAGWNAVTTPLEGTARNYSRQHPEHALRYEIAQEYLDVVKGLWDSWDDDAFIRNRETGQFFERDKLHQLDHKGRFFQVEGPLNIQRSAQGQPVVFQAGSSDAGIGLAGRHADAVFTHSVSLEENRIFRTRVQQAAIAQGRGADDVKIFPALVPSSGAHRQRRKRNTASSANSSRWTMRWPIWAVTSITMISRNMIRCAFPGTRRYRQEFLPFDHGSDQAGGTRTRANAT